MQSDSSIKFQVKATVEIAATFDLRTAALRFTKPDLATGILDVVIEPAASVDAGSGLKNGKLRSSDFYQVAQNPILSFKSTKLSPSAPNTFEVDGNFTIRGITRPEKLMLEVSRRVREITGTMAFDHKDYGMNSDVPFIRITDSVEVSVALKAKRVSGPPVVFRQ